MDEPILPSLPFPTREMLRWGKTASIGLRIDAQSNTGETIAIRGITREGPFTFKFIPTNDAVISTGTFAMSDFPLFVSATNETTGSLRGDSYVRVSIVINGDVEHLLMAGYCYGTSGIAWPSTNIREAAPDIGRFATITGTNQAANVEATDDVPSNFLWRLLSYKIVLVTDANAANRFVHLQLTQSGSVVWEFISTTAQVASTTITYFFQAGNAQPVATDNSVIIVPIPANIFLYPSHTLATATTNRQATDNFGAPLIRVERFFSLVQ